MASDQNPGTETATPGVGREHFQSTLDQIRHDLVTMGSLVLENVRRVGDAMVENRMDLIPQVREADSDIDRMYLEIEQTTFETLARQQPVAGDLRFLISASRIVYELERSGDLAVNCANTLEHTNGFPQHPSITPLLEATVSATCKVFALGLDVLADLIADAGLDAADDEVDDLVSKFYSNLGQFSHEVGLEAAVGFSRVARFLERVADHAVNIGENVTYVVKAEVPEPDRGKAGR